MDKGCALPHCQDVEKTIKLLSQEAVMIRERRVFEHVCSLPSVCPRWVVAQSASAWCPEIV